MSENLAKAGAPAPAIKEELPSDIRFGRFVIDLRRGALFADGTERPLRRQSFALLRHLAEHAGQLVTREEIMEAVWAGTYVPAPT